MGGCVEERLHLHKSLLHYIYFQILPLGITLVAARTIRSKRAHRHRVHPTRPVSYSTTIPKHTNGRPYRQWNAARISSAQPTTQQDTQVPEQQQIIYLSSLHGPASTRAVICFASHATTAIRTTTFEHQHGTRTPLIFMHGPFEHVLMDLVGPFIILLKVVPIGLTPSPPSADELLEAASPSARKHVKTVRKARIIVRVDYFTKNAEFAAFEEHSSVAATTALAYSDSLDCTLPLTL